MAPLHLSGMQLNRFILFKDLATLLLLCSIGYAQVFLMQYALKFDIVDQYFPWRRFAAECYHNGIIPFWNPYQHFGYAFTADPQSGAWYPFVWLCSLFGGYNVYANQLEFFIHVFIGGAGIYFLTRHFTNCRKSSLAAGTVYMLSGFFIGNAQHLSYIISGAWFPWVIYFFLKMSNRLQWREALLFSLSLFMMTAGGYPAFTIITAYILIFLFLYKLMAVIKNRKDDLWKYLRINFFALVTLFLLSSFVIISLWQNVSLIAKSSALPLKVAQFNPFSPQSLISLFWPLVSTTDYSFFNTDMSMANMHFGLVMFTAMLFSFSQRKTGREWLLLSAGFFFLLASFGEYTPVRKWLYDFVPMMDLFRFPSIFRLFALICFLLMAAQHLKKVFADETLSRKFLRWVFLLMISVFIIGLLLSAMKGGTIHWKAWSANGFYDFIQQQGFYDAMMFQSLALMTVSLLTGIFILWKKKPATILIAFIFLEMILAAQINAPKTVYSEFRTFYIDETLAELPAGFPVPENLPAKSFSDSTGFKTPFWRNLSLLRKQPGFDGYNSFRMLYYDSLADNHSLLNEVIKNPVAFNASTVSFYSSSISSTDEKNHLYFHDSLKNKIPSFQLDSSASIRFTHFSPDKMVMETQSFYRQLVTLMQHFHPYWKVKVDNSSVSYFISNYLMMTVPVKEGKHEVTFEIKNPAGVVAYWISLISLILVVIAAILLRAKRL